MEKSHPGSNDGEEPSRLKRWWREGEEGGGGLEWELQWGVDGLERDPGSEEGVDWVKNRPHFVDKVVSITLLDESDLAVNGPDPAGALVLLEELHEGVGGSSKVLRQIEALDAKGLLLVAGPREGVFAHNKYGRLDGRCGEVDDDRRGGVGPGGGGLMTAVCLGDGVGDGWNSWNFTIGFGSHKKGLDDFVIGGLGCGRRRVRAVELVIGERESMQAKGEVA
jgi:hypothetical protein